VQLETSQLPDEYLPLLDGLNAIVISQNVPLEGNLFYYHEERTPGRHNIYDYFYGKRCNFSAATRGIKRMLEIGVNAGHSALLALSNGVEFHGVDICMHPYTQLCADFLKATFGDRFYFYAGDSLAMLPQMHHDMPDLHFDLLHIDGHHGLEYCDIDMRNAMKMVAPNAWILLDDTDMPKIGQYWEELIANGSILPVTPEGWVDNPHHKIGKLAPSL
jgi:hypothetical protein